MEKREIVISGFLWLILLFHPLTTINANMEGDALNALKSNLNDPNRVLQSWDPTLVNPCTWFHVTCNNDNSVIRVDLGNADLSGQLVPDLGRLKNLQYLELYSNKINGPIPSDLGNLTSLVSLDLYLNNFTGRIPESLGKLRNLRFLRLNNNSMTGPIPIALTNVTTLQVLDLSNNFLSGPVPDTGSFSLFTPISFGNNPNLCGPVTGRPCPGSPPFSPPPPFVPPPPAKSPVDRRLDEWVTVERLDLSSLGTNIGKKVDDEEPNPTMTRQKKRRIREIAIEANEELQASLEREKITKVKNIGSIVLGRYEIETWYFSPFPSEYNNTTKLYFCEFCLNFMKHKEQLQRHMRKCDLKHPPGDEIYRNEALSMFEVDGKMNNMYCLQLCYLAKLFLDHKSLVCEVDYFMFYILCEFDDQGYHIVGYFSKERYSDLCYNLACILILPPHQRKGYGKFLIAFSYELSKKAGKAGTPEKPLSDLGRLSYKGYWTRVLLSILKRYNREISVKELSEMTGIWPSDVFCTLNELNLIQQKEGMQFICTDHNVLDRHLEAAGPGRGPNVDVSKLIWTPYDDRDSDSNNINIIE